MSVFGDLYILYFYRLPYRFDVMVIKFAVYTLNLCGNQKALLFTKLTLGGHFEHGKQNGQDSNVLNETLYV